MDRDMSFLGSVLLNVVMQIFGRTDYHVGVNIRVEVDIHISSIVVIHEV